MVDTLYDQLVFRVEQAASEPLERVEAAAVLRTNAEADADRVMDRFVGQAREKGVSWTAIGDRLGVSKQAARQRYSDRVEDLEPQLQPRLRACLAQAQREASADGSDQVQTEHLLVGLLAEGVAAGILEKLGLKPAAIRKAGHQFFGPPGAATSAKPGFSAEATSALETATRLARANRRDWRQTSVGTEHLLAALTFDPGSRARRVLNELNKHAAADIKRELACYLDPNPHGRRRHRGKPRHAEACTFCGRTTTEGAQLVSGPGVWICPACVTIATEILEARAG